MDIKVIGNHHRARGACGHKIYAHKDYFIVKVKEGFNAICQTCMNPKPNSIFNVINVPKDLFNDVIPI